MGPRERIAHQLEMLTKREEHLQRKMDNEIQRARQFSAQGRSGRRSCASSEKNIREAERADYRCASLHLHTNIPGPWIMAVSCVGALQCQAQPALASGPALLTCPLDPGPHHCSIQSPHRSQFGHRIGRLEDDTRDAALARPRGPKVALYRQRGPRLRRPGSPHLGRGLARPVLRFKMAQSCLWPRPEPLEPPPPARVLCPTCLPRGAGA